MRSTGGDRSRGADVENLGRRVLEEFPQYRILRSAAQPAHGVLIEPAGEESPRSIRAVGFGYQDRLERVAQAVAFRQQLAALELQVGDILLQLHSLGYESTTGYEST